MRAYCTVSVSTITIAALSMLSKAAVVLPGAVDVVDSVQVRRRT